MTKRKNNKTSANKSIAAMAADPTQHQQQFIIHQQFRLDGTLLSNRICFVF